mgnify:CR=1 FL=1
MPTYQYLCEKCTKSFTQVESFNGNSKIKCKYCNKKTAIRQFSPPTVLYKGDGWYSKPSKGD